MSSAEARRTALAAQGFTDASVSGVPDRRQLRRVLARTGLFQLDSVSVAVRAHYMPLFSRLGPYDRELLDSAAWNPTRRRPRMLVEYWAHEASLLPVADWPLLRWRMRELGDPRRRGNRELLERSPKLPDEILTAVKEAGPVSAGALERELGGGTRSGKGVWWNRSDTKRACELLFAAGELTTATRRGFERLYDLPERVLPPEVLAEEPDAEEASLHLVSRAARAQGVATEPDLRDYYRLSARRSHAAVSELVERGELEPVRVRGWSEQAYLHRGARTPRSVRARALLSPFDPLVWYRPRAERVFGFHYRLEIYVPRQHRKHGYYVFPFLLDDGLVARVDLKSDRKSGQLWVPGAFAEPGVDTGRVARELAAALREMAGWLGLHRVRVGQRGDLAPVLRALCD
ncbi:winged helix-turn-helix domain-containing protein [Actinopolyspora mortivallis]|uniref:winged helix-turn-helix domain-containing protein n=1 Tax=Actinopolyspora mortivallis TaxID=33906 RepID=UPI00036ADFB9|nr:crosslink repair DNA glycosylase YcaQ family protein [Actinopolyspora mortivallis]